MKPRLVIFLVFIHLFSLLSTRKIKFKGDVNTEICVACKFIWENIQEALKDDETFDVANLQSSNRSCNPILISQSFQYFCQNSPDIFYEGCNFMFEKLFVLINDFTSGKSIEQICKSNSFC